MFVFAQVSYYFGDFNLPRDKFLSEQVKTNEEGWVGIDVMLKFARLSKLSSEGDVILKALQKSQEKLIEVDLENKKVRRNPEMPLPEVEDDEAKKVKTIYLKGFEKTNTTLDDLLGMQEKTIEILKFLKIATDNKTWKLNFKLERFFITDEATTIFHSLIFVSCRNGALIIRKIHHDRYPIGF